MAKTLKLVSNSGIQFENINISINEDFSKKNKIFYLEEFHIEKEIFWFEQVLKNRVDDIWIRKSELQVRKCLFGNECIYKNSSNKMCKYLHPDETMEMYNKRLNDNNGIKKIIL